MPQFDLPLDELRRYRTTSEEPDDLDGFWARALTAARTQAVEPELMPHAPDAYGQLDVQDVQFSGGDGHRIRAWYLRPRAAGTEPLPCRVTFIGYGGGRDLPTEHSLYAACGYAALIMDSRSQGGTWSSGDTPDPGAGASGAEHPGVMTRGIASPETYYYRRMYVDAVRAVETAAALPGVDAERIAVAGSSQGGALALAAAALAPEIVKLCHADVPFLCDIERAIEITPDAPYTELVTYLSLHPEMEAPARVTLRHIDNALLATRIRAKTLVSVGLMDTICPPSTVFAAYNAISAAKDIAIRPFSGHDVPAAHSELQLADFAETFG